MGMTNNTGIVIGIKGQVVEVEFRGNTPFIHDVLVLSENKDVRIEVYQSSKENCFYCFSYNISNCMYQFFHFNVI